MAASICQACGQEYQRTGHYQKWCPDCRVTQSKRRLQKYEEHRRSACPDCGTTISRKGTKCRPCGQKDRIEKIRGPNNYAWKGGIHRDNKGYVHLLVAPEARKGHRYRPEHQLVWEAANGPMPEGYVIHHINGVKDDNRLENLEAMPRKKHNHRHDEHDKRIRELEAEVAALREELVWSNPIEGRDGALYP